MIEKYQSGSVTWVDLLSPTPEEIRETISEYDIEPSLASDLGAPVIRSEAVEKAGTIKITLDFPVVKYTDIEHQHEIKFLITKKALVTVRYADIVSIHKFAKEFEVLTILKQQNATLHSGHLFLALFGTLYDSFGAKLDYIGSKLESIEEEIFREREKEMVFEISKVSRRLIVFRQVLHTHREVLESMSALLRTTFGDGVSESVENIQDRFYYLSRRVAALSESLDELRRTNDSLLSTKQNEIMKTLTIMAFVTYPLTLFSSILGMNALLPFGQNAQDFWIILAVMATAATALLFVFKHKRWI